ncbi:MAG: hypothetical protein CME67_03685 [Halobacteriovoraceae bacterium]|nr:hypothetical protein [Halobacteriovoraceae bacterium]|tara:strand:+ start:2442 stop:2765 length:324 start_codon:yes stop_codon:yes gene_type:complete
MDELKNQVPGGFSAMVNAYLDGSLTSEKESYVEEIVATNPSASKIFQQRSNERDKIKSLIPHVEITKDSLRTLKREVRDINKNLMKTKKTSIASRISSVLNTTIFEF